MADCEHKWVFLRTLPVKEIGYRRWSKNDLFFCEKCLAYKEVEVETK